VTVGQWVTVGDNGDNGDSGDRDRGDERACALFFLTVLCVRN
jgi:hypothetical protein